MNRVETGTDAFRRARSCYDHFAGVTAVGICHSMLEAGWLALDGRDFHVTTLGEKRLAALGVDLGAAQRHRRAFARACTDLTERRPHIAGALGAALLTMYVDRGWVLRAQGSRVVSITPEGEDAFATRFR